MFFGYSMNQSLIKQFNLLDLNYEELEAELEDLGTSKTHAGIIYQNIFRNFSKNFDYEKYFTNNKKDRQGKQLINLISKSDLQLLQSKYQIGSLIEDKSYVAKDGTVKKIFQTHDGKFLESVIIPHKNNKFTFCISSQIGCGMGCKFCVTGKDGLFRNLSAGEIVEQVVTLSATVKPTAIVFMGQGEPISNYKNVEKAIKILTDTRGFNFSSKKITVSTSGLIPGLIKLHKSTGIKLAYSLNATTQEDRTRIMKVNEVIDFETGINQLKDYLHEINTTDDGAIKKKPENLMIEYVMFDGFNDKQEDLSRLIDICKKLEYCFVNLIPYNEHEFAYADFELKQSKQAKHFHEVLIENGIKCFERYEHGADIYAACGMLSNLSKSSK